MPFLLGLLCYDLKAHDFPNKLQLISCRHAETHFRGSLYTIAALDGMTRKHLQNVIVDACRQSMHDCVLCLGHNKGWEEAATSFAVSYAINDMTRQVQKPCAMISQAFWAAIGRLTALRLLLSSLPNSAAKHHEVHSKSPMHMYAL